MAVVKVVHMPLNSIFLTVNNISKLVFLTTNHIFIPNITAYPDHKLLNPPFFSLLAPEESLRAHSSGFIFPGIEMSVSDISASTQNNAAEWNFICSAHTPHHTAQQQYLFLTSMPSTVEVER